MHSLTRYKNSGNTRRNRTMEKFVQSVGRVTICFTDYTTNASNANTAHIVSDLPRTVGRVIISKGRVTFYFCGVSYYLFHRLQDKCFKCNHCSYSKFTLWGQWAGPVSKPQTTGPVDDLPQNVGPVSRASKWSAPDCGASYHLFHRLHDKRFKCLHCSYMPVASIS